MWTGYTGARWRGTRGLTWSLVSPTLVNYLGWNLVIDRLSLFILPRSRAAVQVLVEYLTLRAVEDQWIPL